MTASRLLTALVCALALIAASCSGDAQPAHDDLGEEEPSEQSPALTDVEPPEIRGDLVTVTDERVGPANPQLAGVSWSAGTDLEPLVRTARRSCGSMPA